MRQEQMLIAIVLTAGLIGLGVLFTSFGILDFSQGITGRAVDEFSSQINEPPVYNGMSLSTPPGNALTVDLAAFFSDPEGDALTFLAGEEDQIAISMSDNILTLIPAPDFVGERTLTVVVSDGTNVVRVPVRVSVAAAVQEPTTEPVQEPGFGTQEFTSQDVVSGCAVINTSTSLTGNVFAAGDCFRINASNLVFNCSGFSINGSNSGIAINASSQVNITIKDCLITNFSTGIVANNTNNSFFINNTIFVVSSALSLFSGNFNFIANNTANGTGDVILLITSSSNNLTNNNGTSTANSGISVRENSNNNTLNNNTGTSGTFVGIGLSTSSNNTLFNNTGISTSNSGIYLSASTYSTLFNNTGVSTNVIGLELDSGSNFNQLFNNTGISHNGTGGSGAIRLRAQNNTLIDNIGRANTSAGIFLDTGANNNTLIRNTGISNTSVGLSIASNFNTLYNNSGTSNTSSGIQFASGANNNIVINNTGRSRSGIGIRITTSYNNQNITNNVGISTSSAGIQFDATADNNTFIDNLGISVTSVACGLSTSFNITMRQNRCNATLGGTAFLIIGTTLAHFNHSIDSSNLVNGLPVLYVIGNSSFVVPSGFGYVGVIMGTNITAQHLNTSITFAFINNSVIRNVTTHFGEFVLTAAHNNTITNSSSFALVPLRMTLSNNNTFIDVNVSAISGSAASITTSIDTILLNTRAGSNASSGIILSSSNNTRINNSEFSSNIGQAIRFAGTSQNNTFLNTLLRANLTWVLTAAATTLNNMTNTTFEALNGSIRIVPTVTVPANISVNGTNLNISSNRAFLNSSVLGFLNTSAQITLRGLTFTDPKPQVDFNDAGIFVDCTTPQCTEVSFSGGVFVFDVTGFTTYGSNESFVLIPGAGGGSGGAGSGSAGVSQAKRATEPTVELPLPEVPPEVPPEVIPPEPPTVEPQQEQAPPETPSEPELPPEAPLDLPNLFEYLFYGLALISLFSLSIYLFTQYYGK